MNRLVLESIVFLIHCHSYVVEGVLLLLVLLLLRVIKQVAIKLLI
jgi:hypothetical protein